MYMGGGENKLTLQSLEDPGYSCEFLACFNHLLASRRSRVGDLEGAGTADAPNKLPRSLANFLASVEACVKSPQT